MKNQNCETEQQLTGERSVTGALALEGATIQAPGGLHTERRFGVAAFNVRTLEIEKRHFNTPGEAVEAVQNLKGEGHLIGVHEFYAAQHGPGSASRCTAPVVTNAKPEDIDEMQRIDRAQWGAWANPYPLYRQFLEVHPALVKVARGVHGEVQGFALGLYESSTGEALVLSVDIDDPFRGRGIGRQLVMSLLTEFGRRGALRVTAIISPDNLGSLRMFSRLGFRAAEILPNYFGDGNPQVRYMRMLSVEDAPFA